jgi:flagellin-like protein
MIFERGNKKGISPVVATVVLISVVIFFMVIIAIWYFASVVEQTTKAGNSIEDSCSRVVISLSKTSSNIRITNTGNVPVVGIHIIDDTKKGSNCFTSSAVVEGATGTCSFSGTPEKAYPILKDDKGKSYICFKREISFG